MLKKMKLQIIKKCIQKKVNMESTDSKIFYKIMASIMIIKIIDIV